MKGKIFYVLSFSVMCFLLLSATMPHKIKEVSTKINTFLSSFKPTEKRAKAVSPTEIVKNKPQKADFTEGGVNTAFSPLVAPSESCAEAVQICAGVTVPAKTSGGTVEAGINYGCMGSVPNQTWLYVKIATTGTLAFNVTLSPANDVDFIAWGPFSAPACGASLSAAKIKACDYTTNNGGTANLGAVVAGDYYMILLTNYGAVAGNIAMTIAGGSTAAVECPAPGGNGGSLKLWFKADAGTNTLTNGGAISQWIDQSGQGKNVTQATAGNRPLFVSNGTNFNPAIDYDGVNDYLVNTTIGITGGNKTFFAVTTPQTLPASTVGIIGAGTSLSETQFGYENAKLNMYENIGNTATATTAISTGVPMLSTGMESSNVLSFFNNGTANGMGAYTSTPTSVRFTVGSHTVGSSALPTYKNFWDGYISEVIMYDLAISASDREEVETYLGIKYGITVGHNYLSNNGGIIWDKTANATYHNNVTAIGRDDIQGLNQKQSKSVNASALVTVGNNNTIAATNIANLNSFGANESYLILGDNNGVATWQTTETPTARQTLAREWKISELGTVGSVKIQIPDNSSVLASKLPVETTTVYLLTDADGDFSSGATETAMTLNGTNWEVNYNFSNGQFFTFSTVLPPSPGCVAGVNLWLKADVGASGTAWANQAANPSLTTLAKAGAGTITLNSNNFNFNPSLSFSNAYFGTGATNNIPMSALTDGTRISAYVVGKLSVGGVVVGFQDQTSNFNKFTVENNGPSYYGTGGSTSGTFPNSGLLSPSSTMVTTVYGSSQYTPFTNGTAGSIVASSNNNATNRTFNIMSFRNGSYIPTGDLAEVLVFDATHTQIEREKIETYLALKYGITVGHNYVNSVGTTIYTANGGGATDFDANVFGIGREDCQVLHQKQSKSVNTNGIVTVGLTTIAASNAANTNNLTDDSYLIIGDNNVAAGATAINGATSSACTPPVGMDAIFNRTWKTEETGAVGNTLVSVPTASLTGLGAANPIYLVVADDAALTTNVQFLLMTTNGANQEKLYDFNGVKYFSFAGSLASETYCSGSHYIRWATQGWTAGSLTKTVNLANGLVMTTTVADPQNILRAGYPRLYQGLPMAYINSNSSTKAITWTSQFNQTIASCNFSVYDIDNVGTLAENVDIKGYKGATVVNPVLTKSLVSFVTIGGTTVSGQVNNLTTYSPWAKVNIAFNSPIDKIVITYKNNKNTLAPRGAAMLLSDFTIYCPEPVVTPDKISLAKIAPTGNVNQGDTITYTFKFNNADCGNKTVNFTDVLPTGFTWAPNSLITPLNGTVSNYAGTNTINITGITVPPGMSTFTLNAFAGGAIGSRTNQASFVVNGNTYQSDDPNIAGANDATPIVLVAPPPTAPLTMVKAISKDTVFNTDIVTFTYTFNNTGGTAIVTDFTDEIQPDTVRYKAASLIYGAGQTGTANAYANVGSLYIDNLSIPTGTSVLTVQVEMNGASLGTYKNVATVVPTSTSGFREIEINSNEISWIITQAAAFDYAYGCIGSTVQGSFAANGVTGQTGTVKIPINVTNAGTTNFTVTGTGFSSSLATTITANTAFVIIPITYNGSGTEGSRTLTITSANGTGSCSVQVLVEAACKAEGGRIGQ
jgi:large repetitive protein